MVADDNSGALAPSKNPKNQTDHRERDEPNLSVQSEERHRPTPRSLDIPIEGHAALANTFTSDIDQQKLIKELKSDVETLREQLRLLSKRMEKLENK